MDCYAQHILHMDLTGTVHMEILHRADCGWSAPVWSWQDRLLDFVSDVLFQSLLHNKGYVYPHHCGISLDSIKMARDGLEED